jgi:hypothetical protein
MRSSRVSHERCIHDRTTTWPKGVRREPRAVCMVGKVGGVSRILNISSSLASSSSPLSLLLPLVLSFRYGVEQCTWKPTWTFDSANLIHEFHASALKEGIEMEVLLQPVVNEKASGVVLLREAMEYTGVCGGSGQWEDDFA